MESIKQMIVDKGYYPKMWSIERLKTLVEKGKLTEEEFEQITGKTIH